MCIIHNCAPAAGAADAVCKYGNKCDRHNDTLDQIGGRNSTETAHDCVADDDKRCYDHGNRVINPEKTVKQLAAGSKAGCGVGDKKDDDHNCCNCI